MPSICVAVHVPYICVDAQRAIGRGREVQNLEKKGL